MGKHTASFLLIIVSVVILVIISWIGLQSSSVNFGKPGNNGFVDDKLDMSTKDEAMRKKLNTEVFVGKSAENTKDDGVVVSMESGKQTVSVGEEIKIEVVMDANNFQIAAIQFKVKYDSKKLEFVNVEKGSFFANPSSIGPEIDQSSGEVDYGLLALPRDGASSGKDVVMMITFKTKQIGEARVTLSNESLVGAIDVDATNVLDRVIPLNVLIEN